MGFLRGLLNLKLFKANSENKKILINGDELTDVLTSFKNERDSSGFIMLDTDKAVFIASNSEDIAQLLEINKNLLELVNKIAQTPASVGVAPIVNPDIASALTQIKSDLEGFKIT